MSHSWTSPSAFWYVAPSIIIHLLLSTSIRLNDPAKIWNKCWVGAQLINGNKQTSEVTRGKMKLTHRTWKCEHLIICTSAHLENYCFDIKCFANQHNLQRNDPLPNRVRFIDCNFETGNLKQISSKFFIECALCIKFKQVDQILSR